MFSRNLCFACCILAAVTAVGLSGCRSTEAERAAPAAPVDPEVVVIDAGQMRDGRIQCETVRLAPFPERLQATGRIGVDENRTSMVSSLVDGKVVTVLANVGDHVHKGKLLAQVHSHEVHETRSDYAKARAELNRRQGELEFATNARDRAARLYALKAISLEQLQRAETDLRSAQLGITTSQAEINRIQERLHHLGLTTEGAEEEYSTPGMVPGMFEEAEVVPVVAPLSGTVLQRFISPGKVVTPATDLLLISDLDSLWVQADVPERFLADLRVGRPVEISVRAYGDRVFPGRITSIGDTLNPETRTVQVRCQTDNRSRLLKPEMYATVGFELGETRQAILISGEAIQEVDNHPVVFLREQESRFRVRRIETGRSAGGQMEVREGLKVGEVIATAGSFLLKSELLKQQAQTE